MKNVANNHNITASQSATQMTLNDGAGTTLVWDPAADPAEVGAVGWDLLAGADTVIAADRIAEALLSAADDIESLMLRPEADLLCADLITAAARGGQRFETVLDWVTERDLAPARQLLAATGDAYLAEDLDWFTRTPAAEQRGVWRILTRALEPLREPSVLACLQRNRDSIRLPGALGTLFTTDQISQPGQLLVVARPHTRGAAAALVDRLLWAAHEHGVRIDAQSVDELRHAR